MSTSLLSSVTQSRSRSKAALQASRESVYGSKDFADVSGGGVQSTQLSDALGGLAGSQYSVFKNWVYVCINSISARVGGQPVRVGKLNGAEANPERGGVPGGLKATIPEFLKQVSGELEVLNDHAILDLIAAPNPVQRKRELLFMMVANLYLTGESYLLRDGEPGDGGGMNLWAIPTSWVTPIHKDGLFSAYKISFGNRGIEEETFPAEMVSRTYFPDPANLKSALAPVAAIMTPIRTDDHIQGSQEKMFENGIFPRFALKAGGFPSPDGTTAGDKRAVLTQPQRRQLNHTIRKLYSGVVNYGEPPIIDGIIDDIVKLSSTPEEMDWLNSGTQIKDRIFQAFGVNPIVVGAITPANKAQAVEAEKNLCSQVVNPLISAISDSLTEFLGPLFDTEDRIKIWLEECHPVDEDLKLKKWIEGRKNEDVTRNEYRAEILGLPPEEATEGRSRLLDMAQTMGEMAKITSLVNQEKMTVEQGVSTLMLALQVDEEQAKKLVSGGESLPKPDPNAFSRSTGDSGNEAMKKLSSLTGRLRRSDIKSIALLQQGTAERQVVATSQRVIAAQIESIVAEMKKLGAKSSKVIQSKTSDQQANAIMEMVFRPVDWVAPMVKEYTPVIGRMIAEGAITEAELHSIADTGEAKAFEGVDLEDLTEGIDPTLPDWVIDATKVEMDLIFSQDYWLRIPETTNIDVRAFLNKGLIDGQSITEIAKEITTKFGQFYTKARAVAIARTETSAALNAGHVAGIKHVEEETGIVTGKEWLSVLGTTTRDDHAATDGQRVKTADGLFNLGGELTPYPSHFSLSPGQRINCQCTIISTMIIDSFDG